MPIDVSRALITATYSSRFVIPNYWADPKSGIAYQVQVEIPRRVLRTPYDVDTTGSIEDLSRIPLNPNGNSPVLLRDIAELVPGSMPGQYDRYNMRRQITLTANMASSDLGQVAREVAAAIERAGAPPKGVEIQTRGQIPPMNEMQSGLTMGILLAIAAVFLLLMANFQSIRLSLAAVATIPGVLVGVVLILYLTGTTLNVQSYIGTIMAVGVAMANAILLITVAEQQRRSGLSAAEAGVAGGSSRLRAILMTTCAMMAGMLPMALGLGEAGQQNAPLGRAVIGGLIAATITTLLLLPSIFAFLQSNAAVRSSSLDPDDDASQHFKTSIPA
jgi:multidrug efflux pump subunit AcrB